MAYVISHVQREVVKIWNALTHHFITIHVNRVALVSIPINNTDTVEAIPGTLFLLYSCFDKGCLKKRNSVRDNAES